VPLKPTKNTLRIKIILILLAVALVLFAFVFNKQLTNTQTNTVATNFIVPDEKQCQQFVTHTAYCLCYSEAHEQANWVSYLLTKDMCETNAVERVDKFIADPLVKTKSAEHTDYKNSGYDRGHLCPAGDMNYSMQTMQESFYMSNISPQLHAFNAGIWERLENKVRKWAIKHGQVNVICGPVLTSGLPTIGTKNKVAVPQYFYKIICTADSTSPQAIAFIIENKDWDKKSFFDFVVTIDSVEKITGLNFFEKLSNKKEEELESELETGFWKN
jgi:endonuclease G